MTKVSVIIPCYNMEKFLQPCFDALQSQTLQDIEMIFVDDGSTKDNTPALLDGFAARESRAKVIHQQNKGLGEARNVGMLAAQGEYIGLYDPDDLIPANFYEVLYNTARKFDADVAWTNLKRCYPPQKRKKDKYFIHFEQEKALDYSERFEAMGKASYVMSKVYRREFLVTPDRHLFFDRPFYEDMMFTSRVLHEAKTVVSTPDSEYFYLYNPKSISVRHQNFTLQRNYYEALRELRSFFIEKGIPVPRKWRHIRKWTVGIGDFSLIKAKDFGSYTLVRLFDLIPVWITFNKDFQHKSRS